MEKKSVTDRMIPHRKNKLLNPKRLAEVMKPGVLNLKVMQKESCSNGNLSVSIKTKRKPRFKAGAELSGAVNVVAVEVNEDIIEDMEVFEMKITLDTKRCVADESCAN